MPTSSLSVPSIAFFGRTLSEYLAMFALSPDELVPLRIADVAAGPSSFTVEARVSGINVTALDPLYGLAPTALAAHVQGDYRRMETAMSERPEAFSLRHYPSLAAAFRSRRLAAERFLADYEHGFAQGRYVGGALPRLPFADGAFDLVLCAHLLFLYQRHFDLDWHLAACRELTRVAAKEVRIHPLCGLDGREYPQLSDLLSALNRCGIAARVQPIAYEFFLGGSSMLVLRRARPPRSLGAAEIARRRGRSRGRQRS